MEKAIRLTPFLIIAVAKVKEYIDAHPLEIIKTDELAAYAGVSRNLLQKGFKQINNIHIKEYYTTVRMASAKQMLVGGLSVRQVAKLCHYKSHSAFTTAFKNKFRMPPMVWIQQNKAAKNTN